VDNTSDANKPVSTATTTALAGKAASVHTHAATDIDSGTLADARLSANVAMRNAANDFGGNTIAGFTTVTASDAGTSITLAAATHGGRILETTAATAVALTLPNSLPVGANGVVTQVGAGQVTFTAGAGATIRQADSFTKTAKQYAEVSWRVRANSGGSAAEYVLSGNMA
jgi:hypothetical protein